jgi:hypothetical protein
MTDRTLTSLQDYPKHQSLDLVSGRANDSGTSFLYVLDLQGLPLDSLVLPSQGVGPKRLLVSFDQPE